MEYINKHVEDLHDHRLRVGRNLMHVSNILTERGLTHDSSKMSKGEYPYFVESTEKLAGLTYGSSEYKAQLKKIQPALDHHYLHNPHHPEYWSDGVDGMSIFDFIEMVCDWHAAVSRHDNGDIYKSLEVNQERFGLSSAQHQAALDIIKELERAQPGDQYEGL